jgi:hypothetical protein
MRGIARQIAYSVIDFASNRRRAQEWTAARTRWEAAKVVFAAERRAERPMTYREFALAGAAAGDRVSESVASVLLGVTVGSRQTPSRAEPTSAPAQERNDLTRPQRSMSIAELRTRLAQIGEESSELREQARVRREELERIAPPPKLEEVLAAERAALRTKVASETDFTDAEWRHLTELRRRLRSWNPIAGSIARAEAQQMLDTREKRGNAALGAAQEQFEKDKVPEIQRRIEALERPYREYVQASYGYEDQMRDAGETLRRSIPKISERLEVLERAGVASLEPVSPSADLTGIGRAVAAAYRSLPEETTRVIEREMRREERNRDRDRDRGMDFDR